MTVKYLQNWKQGMRRTGCGIKTNNAQLVSEEKQDNYTDWH